MRRGGDREQYEGEQVQRVFPEVGVGVEEHQPARGHVGALRAVPAACRLAAALPGGGAAERVSWITDPPSTSSCHERVTDRGVMTHSPVKPVANSTTAAPSTPHLPAHAQRAPAGPHQHPEDEEL